MSQQISLMKNTAENLWEKAENSRKENYTCENEVGMRYN